MLTTTINEIYSYRPCAEGFAKLLNSLFDLDINPDDNIAEMRQQLTDEQFNSPVTLLQVLDSNGFDDALWCLRCWDFRAYGEMVVQWAESVEHYAEDYPAVAECNRATRRWLQGEITDDDLSAAAQSAAWSAAESAARSAAESAAWSAARSARSARPAAESARFAWSPWSAAWSAAESVRSAARFAGSTQKSKNEKIMRRFLNEEN